MSTLTSPLVYPSRFSLHSFKKGHLMAVVTSSTMPGAWVSRSWFGFASFRRENAWPSARHKSVLSNRWYDVVSVTSTFEHVLTWDGLERRWQWSGMSTWLRARAWPRFGTYDSFLVFSFILIKKQRKTFQFKLHIILLKLPGVNIWVLFKETTIFQVPSHSYGRLLDHGLQLVSCAETPFFVNHVCGNHRTGLQEF